MFCIFIILSFPACDSATLLFLLQAKWFSFYASPLVFVFSYLLYFGWWQELCCFKGLLVHVKEKTDLILNDELQTVQTVFKHCRPIHGLGDENIKSHSLELCNSRLESHLFASEFAFYTFAIKFDVT